MNNAVNETFEWVQSWVDHAEEKTLPRVLLIGDSITRGYESAVRRLLSGVCHVDFVATSYAIDNPTFHSIVTGILDDLPYALVHFNHGLHGWHISDKEYETRMEQFASALAERAKVMLVTSTVVLTQNKQEEDPKYKLPLHARNEAVLRIADKRGYPIDDLASASRAVPTEEHTDDGFHYTTAGYEMLAEQVAREIRAVL